MRLTGDEQQGTMGRVQTRDLPDLVSFHLARRNFWSFESWKYSICSIILFYTLLTLGKQVNGSKFAKEMAANESRILSNRKRP